jgi:O-acetyl-ADP-ribose deacetylase (regulator of RNase III)
MISKFLYVFFLSACSFSVLYARNEFTINGIKLVILEADITKLHVDAIVSAANSYLPANPGGVAGAIYQAAGAKKLNNWIAQHITKNSAGIYIEVSNAVATPSFAFEKNGVKRIIHAVGPDARLNQPVDLVYDTYLNSLLLADRLQMRSIAFPAISTNIFAQPKQACAALAVEAIKTFSSGTHSSIKTIYLTIFSDKEYKTLLLNELHHLPA